MPSVVSIPPNISTAAFEIASSSVSDASVTGRVTCASRTADPGAAITLRRLAASSANAAVPAGPASPAGPWAVAASACTAATIPSYQARTLAGSAWPRPSTWAMTVTASGPGHGPAQFGRAVRLDDRHQAAGLGPGEQGEPRVHLVVPEGAVKRTPVARVRRAVQREHARPDHLGRGETRIVDGESPRVAEDRRGQVVPGDEPGAQDRHPADRRSGAQPGQHRMRIGLQVRQRDQAGRRAGRRHP